MGFNIQYHTDALKDLEIIKERFHQDCESILKKIENTLTLNPFPSGKTVKKLKNIQPALYRLRINALQGYRVFYRIIGNSVYIIKVVPKKDADKILRRYF